MPRRESRGHRLPTGGYREHRLAIWGVTGCVAVAAGVALTAGLAAASPHLANIPGDTPDRRPALAGLPTVHPSPTAGSSVRAETVVTASESAPDPAADRTASPSPRPTAPQQPTPTSTPVSTPAPTPHGSSWPHSRTAPPWHR